MCNALGIAPAMVPPPAKYSAMERGVIDGMGISTTGAMPLAIHEVAKYRIDHVFLPGGGAVVVMGLNAWNKLGKKNQDLLVAKFNEMDQEMEVLMPKLISFEREFMKKNGVELIQFPEPDKDWYMTTLYNAKSNELRELLGDDVFNKCKVWLTTKP